MRQRHNPHQLDEELESHLSSFMEKAERVSNIGWRLISNLRAYPVLSRAIKDMSDALDKGIEIIDDEIDKRSSA